jgi:2,3-dihydroxybenzoate decarboxylase
MPSPLERSKIITLEEHYLDAELAELLKVPNTATIRKLLDLDGARLAEMDEAGIDVQVLSHSAPGLQRVDEPGAVELARRVNDRLHRTVQSNPARFAAFASLPTAAPDAAARELERAVTKLGFKGAMIHGLTGGRFIDDRCYRPILRCAEELDVPLYLHPAEPHPAVVNAYYQDFIKTHPILMRAAWGFTFEAGTEAVRLILSGALDAFPRLKIILGHLGEAIPFLMSRIDEAFSRDSPMKDFRGYFHRHFFVTTSGFFSDVALRCCIDELTAERILFSVDWPYVSNKPGIEWIRKAPVTEREREMILHENAARLLRLSPV